MIRKKINGICLIYHHFVQANAPTILEHVDAFSKYSEFKVWKINTEFGFPKGLAEMEFSVVVLHYSLFGWLPFPLPEEFQTYLESCDSSYKVAFFQDEHHHWPQRSAVLNRLKPDCIYTLVEPEYWEATYFRHYRGAKMVYNIPGYVSDEMTRLAAEFGKPDAERRIDVGYRGRRCAFYMGRASQEKHEIGVKFKEMAKARGLTFDVETEEHMRIYGDDWYRFTADCRGVLGVEAGVSIFDINNEVRPQYEKLLAENPDMSLEEMENRLLGRYEDNIYYRTISARHFEAAAFRVCQILFEGKYSGILEPMVHYIPLKKDFSNIDQALELFRDDEFRNRLTDNAYRDLIESGRYSFRALIEEFDRELKKEGLKPGLSTKEISVADRALRKGLLVKKAVAISKKAKVDLKTQAASVLKKVRLLEWARRERESFKRSRFRAKVLGFSLMEKTGTLETYRTLREKWRNFRKGR